LNPALVGKYRAHLFGGEKMAQEIGWQLRAQSVGALYAASRRITVIGRRIQLLLHPKLSIELSRKFSHGTEENLNWMFSLL
jgi:hypothetical protein